MMMEAMAIYRQRFRPSEQLAAPHVMLGINVIAADTDAEARRLFSSLQQSFLNLRSGRPGKLPPPVEDFDAGLDPYARAMLDDALACSDRRRRRRRCGAGFEAFVACTGADELMVTAHIFDHAKRKRSFRIVAGRRAGAVHPRAAAEGLSLRSVSSAALSSPDRRPTLRSVAASRGELVGALAPALVEAHLLVRLAVGDGPVAHAGGVSRLAALILERQDHRHERLGRRLPRAG